MAAISGRQLLRRAVSSHLDCTSRIAPSLLASAARPLPRIQLAPSHISSPAVAAFRSCRSFHASANRQDQHHHDEHQQAPPPPPPPHSKPASVKFWPFILIIGLGFGGYALLVKQRVEMPAVEKRGLPAPNKSTPTFSADDVTVVFVLGGPGAGKGTQCARLVKDYGFTHLSAGDLLRAEQERAGSEFGELIADCIKNGAIVPMEVTVALLENAMTEVVRGRPDGRARFLIDGFPRKMDQAVKFEEVVCPARLVLFYDCPEDEMERRLLERGKTSGRADDNADSIRKRFRTFIETSMPVVDHFEKQNKVVKVNATPTADEVYKTTREQLAKQLGSNF